MNRYLFFLLLGILTSQPGITQPGSFTYQGEMRLTGQPFTGLVDLEFRLYDQLSGGVEIGSAQWRPDQPVEDGLFQVELDFGVAAFDGSDRFLEVIIDGTGLTPRQKITATPYALLAGGVLSGSIGGISIDPSEVQLRVLGTCPSGEYVQAINLDGSVVCGEDANAGGTVISIETGAGLQGGPITDAGTLSIAPGGVGTAQINSTQVQQRVAGTCPAGQSIRVVNQDGSVICEVDDQREPAWTLNGNAGTDPATNFIGTTDSAALELRTANVRGLRIEPSEARFGGNPITTNTIAGSIANEVLPGVRGATISGGGVPSGDSDPDIPNEKPNRVTDHFGTVGGGWGNNAGDGSGTVLDANFATVGGGFRNSATGAVSTVAGGASNIASGRRSTVVGGNFNDASGAFSTVGGGRSNCAGGHISWAGGNGAKVRPATGVSFTTDSACNSAGTSGDDDGDEGSFVWADLSTNDDFFSSGPNQFLVRAEGGIGFGRAPSDYFEVDTPFAQAGGDGSGTPGALRIRLDGTTRLRLLGNGGLAIGNSYQNSGVPENGLRVSGVVGLDTLGSAGSTSLCRNASGEIASCSSSARYKQDIAALDLGLSTVLTLQPVGFRWSVDGLDDIGFLAEDIAAIDERLITRNESGDVEGVRYDRITAVLANALQEMEQRHADNALILQSMQTRLNQLDRQNAKLQNELGNLQQQSAQMQALKERNAALESRLAALQANEL